MNIYVKFVVFMSFSSVWGLCKWSYGLKMAKMAKCAKNFCTVQIHGTPEKL